MNQPITSSTTNTRLRKSVVPPIQLARNGYNFSFAGLIIRPLAVGLGSIRISWKWAGDHILPHEDGVTLLSHEEFNNLINQ